MKKIVEYQCEICHKKYLQENSALDCEALGIAEINDKPIGLMYEYYHNNYIGIFAIGKLRTGYSPHQLEFSSWGFRCEPYPYSTVGDNFCGTGSDYFPKDIKNFRGKISEQNVGNAEFNLMVEYLKSKNITPKYFNDQRQLIEII